MSPGNLSGKQYIGMRYDGSALLNCTIPNIAIKNGYATHPGHKIPVKVVAKHNTLKQ